MVTVFLFYLPDHKVITSNTIAGLKYKNNCWAISIEKEDSIHISKVYETSSDTYLDLQEYGKAIDCLI